MSRNIIIITMLDFVLNVAVVGAWSLVLAALLVDLLAQRHQPHTHQEPLAVHFMLTPGIPPDAPPVPFFHGNSLDIANQVSRHTALRARHRVAQMASTLYLSS